MAPNKQIQELLIQVKQKGIKPATTAMEKLSESINDAALYTDDLNASLNQIKVPKALSAMDARLDSLNNVFEDIRENTELTNRNVVTLNNNLVAGFKDSSDAADVAAEKIDDLNDSMAVTATTSRSTTGELKKQTKVWDQVAAGTNKVNNGLKRHGKQGGATVRNFSDMSKSAGTLASTYALVAANVFALSEAFRLMNEAANTQRLIEIADVMSGSVGLSVRGVADELRAATGGAISFQEALKFSATGATYGFAAEQLEGFTQVARRASAVLGVEMTDALNRVIRGVSKQEIELLDELGVTVRLNEAFAQYATEHGVAADSLNAFQRQNALSNAVLKQSEQRLGSVDEALRATEWEKFGANVSSSTNELLRMVSTSGPVLAFLDKVNESFQIGDDLAKARATSTAATSSADKAAITPGQLDDILTYNTLLTEQSKLEADLKVAVAATSAERRRREENNIIGDTNTIDLLVSREAALRNELNLTSKALAGNTAQYKLNSLTVGEAAAEIANLSILSKTINSDLLTQKTSLTGSGEGYITLARTASEAEATIAKLSQTSLSQAEIYKQLGIAEADIPAFKADLKFAKEYSATMESIAAARASEVASINVRDAAADRAVDTAKSNLRYVEKEYEKVKDLDLMDSRRLEWAVKRKDAEEGVLKSLEAQQKSSYTQIAAYAALNDSQQTNVQAANELLAITRADLEDAKRKKSTQDYINAATLKEAQLVETLRSTKEAEFQLDQQKIRTLDDFVNRDLESTDMAKAKLETESRILANLQAQGAAISVAAIEAQKLVVISASRAVTTSEDAASQALQDTNVDAARGAISSLSPDLGSATDSIYAGVAAWDLYGQSAKDASDLAAAAGATISSGLGAISGVLQAASGSAVSAIDAQIAAIKGQGNVTEEEQAKIMELEKKKIKEQEKFAKASILIDTAAGIMSAFATSGNIYASIGLAAAVAASGALAYSQASNSASSQLSGLTSAAGDTPTSLALGDTQANAVDVSQQASFAERGQSLGDKGSYGRATGGKMRATANTGYIAGENGPELITPIDANVSNASDTKKMMEGGKGSNTPIQLNVSAMDASSFEEWARNTDLLTMLDDLAGQGGKRLLSN